MTRRYLGITGIVIDKVYYEQVVCPSLDTLKRRHFTYDIDDPPILVRSLIIHRKSSFWVLRDQQANDNWEQDLLAFFSTLKAQIFTVVINKHTHLQRFPQDAYDPYHYSLSVLLNRIRGFLNLQGATADIMPESRGRREDNKLMEAYDRMRTQGFGEVSGAEYRTTFSEARLLFREKQHNVAGLQIADLVAAEQKAQTLLDNHRPIPSPQGPFGRRLNQVLQRMVNRYGRYLLE